MHGLPSASGCDCRDQRPTAHCEVDVREVGSSTPQAIQCFTHCDDPAETFRPQGPVGNSNCLTVSIVGTTRGIYAGRVASLSRYNRQQPNLPSRPHTLSLQHHARCSHCISRALSQETSANCHSSARAADSDVSPCISQLHSSSVCQVTSVRTLSKRGAAHDNSERS